MNKMFPTLLIIMDLCAAIAYAPSGEWRRVVYWVAAAVITASVTW